METKNTTACRVPFHDSMPSFMNFRRVLDLLEFKNKVSQHFASNQRCPGVRNSFLFFGWDLSMHPRTKICFFNQFICTWACACSSNLNYAHKCIENSVNAKKCPNAPKNPKNWHNTLVVLCWHGNFFESNMRQWILFRPERWDVPYRKPSCLLWVAPLCEKHIPKPAPNGTKNLPRHVDAAPW